MQFVAKTSTPGYHAWESRDLCCGKQPNEFGGVAPTKSKF